MEGNLVEVRERKIALGQAQVPGGAAHGDDEGHSEILRSGEDPLKVLHRERLGVERLRAVLHLPVVDGLDCGHVVLLGRTQEAGDPGHVAIVLRPLNHMLLNANDETLVDDGGLIIQATATMVATPVVLTIPAASGGSGVAPHEEGRRPVLAPPL